MSYYNVFFFKLNYNQANPTEIHGRSGPEGSLTRMFLEYGRKLESSEKTHVKFHAERPQVQPGA